MANQALVIDVEAKSVPNGSLNQWSQLGNKDVFIRDILTPKLNARADIGALVSGIPTAFARVDLFKTALDFLGSATPTDRSAHNLSSYYVALGDEWRGLIAALALDYANAAVKRVNLAYSDGRDIDSTANIYEPAGAFGNMLLQRRERWCDQTLAQNEKRVPFINIVRYLGRIVGATAPECLLFTSSAYKIEPSADRPWVDKQTGKFTDPLKGELNATQTATLHAYIHHLWEHLKNIEEYYQKLPPDLAVDYTSIRLLLERWRQEVETYAENHNFNLSIGSTPPVNVGFSAPFAAMFNFKDELFGVEGQISETPSLAGAISFDPKKLMLPSNSKIARIILGAEFKTNPKLLNELPVYVMKAAVKGTQGEYAYFALPLSAEGLNVYGKTIGALVEMGAPGARVDSRLEAVFDPALRENNLAVTLTINTETGKSRHYSENYTVNSSQSLRSSDLLLWPNFISKQWNDYFLYSEMPHNANTKDYSAFPFVGDTDDDYFRILTSDDDGSPMLLAENGEIVVPADKVDARLLVRATTAASNNAYRYEIYRSNRPFKGVRLQAPTGEEGGYLIINYSADPSTTLPRNLLNRPKTLQEVNLGVDFGSTNTSIAFSSTQGEKGFAFGNRRVSLMGRETPGRPQPPRENQILFFPGSDRQVPSNAIKSVLTLHDELRLPPLAQGEDNTQRLGREVVGGFPCFMDNLPVAEVSDESITLSYPTIGLITQAHNMKWNNPEVDNAHKKAFLRTLMLQVYAELFLDDKVPVSLKWSYPSSMSNKLLNSYQLIWDSLRDLSPVSDASGEPYHLDISKYAATLNLADGDTSFSSFTDGDGGAGAFGGDFSGGFGGSSGFGDTGFGTPDANAPFGGAGGGFGSSFGQTAPPASPQGGFGDDPSAPRAFGANAGGFATGGPDAFSGGFGSSFAGGFGTETPRKSKLPDLKPDDPNRTVEYHPEPLLDTKENSSLTEATAVANYTSTRYGSAAGQLTLCFDIGGSTTDISALYMLRDGLTMVKQNSLRFAAQMVSRATAAMPGFKKVLNKICNQFGIKMLGLNAGDDRYKPEMAPYFFDQIVDRLTPDQLRPFYMNIMAECPALMGVNMYVTGLLMFYAGQIANKLVDDINHAGADELLAGDRRKPLVMVTFAGKGSRLYQWLGAVNPKLTQDYYNAMFELGFGGRRSLTSLLANWPRITLPTDTAATEVKYEVSKGLAKGNTDLYRPKGDNAAEIIGEEGFTVTSLDGSTAPISQINSFTPEMMESMGVALNPAQNGDASPRFANFLKLFYNCVTQILGMRLQGAVFAEGLSKLNIVQYAQNLPEFRQAKAEADKGTAPFDFVAPVIILEGMKFYQDFLLRALK